MKITIKALLMIPALLGANAHADQVIRFSSGPAQRVDFPVEAAKARQQSEDAFEAAKDYATGGAAVGCGVGFVMHGYKGCLAIGATGAVVGAAAGYGVTSALADEAPAAKELEANE